MNAEMFWWLIPGAMLAALIRIVHELIRDRRENGEWLWTAWREEQRRRKADDQD